MAPSDNKNSEIQDSALAKSTSLFFRLPAELRNVIYDLTLDWPDLKQPFEKVRKQYEVFEHLWVSDIRPRCVFMKPHIPTLITPTILLLNRTIYMEAIGLLHSKLLVLESVPPHSAQLGRAVDITKFISEATLQSVPYVLLKLDLNGDSWLTTIDMLVNIWVKNNKLKSLRVKITGPPKWGSRFPRSAVAETIAQASL